MKKVTKKIVFLFIFILIAFTGFSQTTDTFYVEKVLIKNELISPKNGKVMRVWWKKKKVKSGYILRQPDGTFVINGKVMIPDSFSYKTEVAKTNGK